MQMKIYSIKTNISSRTYNNNNRLKFQPKYQSPITFNGSDTYQGSSFIDKQINDLKNNIETKISPLKDKYKQEFLQVGLIGYDSQEKLKLIRKYETALMNKKLQTPENTDLISATKNAILYEKYLNNINEFERTAEFAAEHNYCATPEILRYIEKSRPKIYRDNDEFENLKPFYNKYRTEKESMEQSLNKITSAGLPEFSEKIKQLDEQNKTAVILMIISGYLGISDINREASKIYQDYTEQKEPLYKLLERIESLNNKIQKFDEEKSTHEKNISELKDFIAVNKDYKTKNLSEETITKTYQKLLHNTDTVILNYIDSLKEYAAVNPAKISPRIVERTFNAQAKINKKLNNLIQKEKQKLYEQTNNEFQKRFE